MVISEVKHAIDALEQALPESFIFVLDTTDRSFIYKSLDCQDSMEKVIAFDHQHGIDKITNGLEYYTSKKDDTLIFKKLSTHSFLGIYLKPKEYNLKLLDLARNILKS